MLVACVSIPHFALRVAILDQPELDGAPLILGSPAGARPVVLDATPEAAARGIRPGLGLREVPALCPAALILPPHPLREATALNAIITALEQVSPAVEADPARPGCLYVDLTGLDRTLGAPEDAARLLLARIAPVLRPRLGLAPGKFAAKVAAGGAPPGGYRLVEPAAVVDFLARAPVTWLPLPPELLRKLERFGLRRLGDLANLPVTAVQARFGPAGRRAHELASGRDDATIQPRHCPEHVTETLVLPAPITSREMLLVALTRLVGSAFARPALRTRHVRHLHLRAEIEGNRSWELAATLREPGGQHRVITALSYRLQAIMLPGPIETITIELSGLINSVGRQELLPGPRPRRPRQLAEAGRHLKQRYGVSGLFRVVEVEPWSRIPERRQALLVYDP
ncbi:MAG: DNA polymerase Y family protein [Chloroflexota bacterium]|nr:DNA polymerase Y family protein [Chloroflexota bacterium]